MPCFPPCYPALGRLRTGFRGLLAAAVVAGGTPALAINRSWDDGGVSKLWSDVDNWSSNGSPDDNDIFIGDLASAAGDRTLFDDNAIDVNSLTITGGAGVVNSTDEGVTNDYRIEVNGATTVTGVGSSIVLYGGSGAALDTDTLTLGAGGSLVLDSTTPRGTAVAEIDNGPLRINSGGRLTGTGRIDLKGSPATPAALLINNGAITASAPTAFFGATPAAGVLQITSADSDARFDWDGVLGTAALSVNGNQTLDVDVDTGSDAFDGTMNLATGSTIDIENAWSIDTGVINVDTQAFGPIVIGNDPIPGAAATITGADWAMTGGVINVADTWDSLWFNSGVNATGGVINNSGLLLFHADATFGSGVDFNMMGPGSSLVVNATVNIQTPDFDFDGPTNADNVATINAGGTLDLDLGSGSDLFFNHTINLNGFGYDVTNDAELDVTTPGGLWVLSGDSEVNVAGGGLSHIRGDDVRISGSVNVTGGSRLQFGAPVEYVGAQVEIGAGSMVDHAAAVYRGGSYTGDGVLKPGNAIIANDTTWAVDTVDLDDGPTTVNDGAKLTVNTNRIDNLNDGFDSTIRVKNSGRLEINLAGGADVVFDGGGRLVYNGDATGDTFLTAPASGSALAFSAGSEISVDGQGASEARIKLNGGALNINAHSGGFRMQGGGLTPGETNEIADGAINGPGELQIASGRALRGYGFINAPIDGDGGSQLIATGGVLNLNGGVEDIGLIGTEGAGAVLNVNTLWNTNVADQVILSGGEIRGATITNDLVSGIRGSGLITSRVVNNSRIVAAGGGALVVNNPANNNDWDGVGDVGILEALNNSTLELRDDAFSLGFSGTVNASRGTVFANGFSMSFGVDSNLNLFEGVYRATNLMDIFGAINVSGTAASRLNGDAVISFFGSSTTTLNADLELEHTSLGIAAGATFSGGGGLINLNGGRLVLLDGAHVGVEVTNEGDLDIAGGGVGRGDVAGFTQTADGRFLVDVQSPLPGDFDQLVVAGAAQLDGVLDLNLIDGYDPSPGFNFTILSATGGVSGEFASLDDSSAGLGPGLMWQVVHNPTKVQLEVILGLPGDFNNDSVVDAADYTVWRDNLGSAATLPGDPTPGMVTDADYDVWVTHYGSTAHASAMAFAAASTVPEPGSFALLLAGVLSEVGLRRRSAA